MCVDVQVLSSGSHTSLSDHDFVKVGELESDKIQHDLRFLTSFDRLLLSLVCRSLVSTIENILLLFSSHVLHESQAKFSVPVQQVLPCLLYPVVFIAG